MSNFKIAADLSTEFLEETLEKLGSGAILPAGPNRDKLVGIGESLLKVLTENTLAIADERFVASVDNWLESIDFAYNCEKVRKGELTLQDLDIPQNIKTVTN